MLSFCRSGQEAMFDYNLRSREMRDDLVTFSSPKLPNISCADNFSGVCQNQTQSKALISKCIAILKLRLLQHPYRQCASLHDFTHALYRQRHVASSCTKDNISAMSILTLSKTNFSRLVDTTFPWSVPIRVSCSTDKEKFLFVLVNPHGDCPISWKHWV